MRRSSRSYDFEELLINAKKAANDADDAALSTVADGTCFEPKLTEDDELLALASLIPVWEDILRSAKKMTSIEDECFMDEESDEEYSQGCRPEQDDDETVRSVSAAYEKTGLTASSPIIFRTKRKPTKSMTNVDTYGSNPQDKYSNSDDSPSSFIPFKP